MTKTIAALAVVAFALAGCSTGGSEAPVDLGEAFAPAPTLTVTEGQTMTELLMPPTDAVVSEVPKGSLGVFIEDYAPQPVMDTFLDTYLPEGDK